VSAANWDFMPLRLQNSQPPFASLSEIMEDSRRKGIIHREDLTLSGRARSFRAFSAL
jgi:hypothetical protein